MDHRREWCLYVDGSGEWYDDLSDNQPDWYWENVPFTKVVFSETLKSIGECAFKSAEHLESVIIPEGIERISYGAFYNCTSLKTVKISSSVCCIEDYAFYNCTSLSDVYLTDLNAWFDIEFTTSNLNFTGHPLSYATSLYLNDELLTDIIVPDGVTEVKKHAFYGYDGYFNLDLNDVETVNDFAFYDCAGLDKVYISDSFKTLGWNSFKGGCGINELHIRDLASWCNVHVYGNNSLIRNNDLYLNGNMVTELVIPDDVTEIKSHVFEGLSEKITKLVIPPSLKKIGSYAFGNAYGDLDVYISDLKSYCEIEMSGILFNREYDARLYLNNEMITELVLPKEITKVNDKVFCNFYYLSEFVIYNDDIELFDNSFPSPNQLYSEDKKIICNKKSAADTFYKNKNFVVEYFDQITVDEMTIALNNIYNVKDIFFAHGYYYSYRDIKNNLEYGLTSAKLGDNNYYSYNATKIGAYSVLIRYNDGRAKLFFASVDANEPTFTPNGMQLKVGNLEGVKVIRTAYGDYNTVAEIKRGESARAFTSKDVLANVTEYTVQYRNEGLVSVAVCYENGYSVIYKYEVVKKSPIMKQTNNTVSFEKLDDLKVIRYAMGEYQTSSQIKNAEGSISVSSSKINADSVSFTLDKGRYTFCVQYNDESYNYYVVNVE
ncbi:MAG: hypothetical protein E7591_00445 [Ruminococcaceae bacterium]|nr:hypothetical protein [Oscillospiraceae bacterium]